MNGCENRMRRSGDTAPSTRCCKGRRRTSPMSAPISMPSAGTGDPGMPAGGVAKLSSYYQNNLSAGRSVRGYCRSGRLGSPGIGRSQNQSAHPRRGGEPGAGAGCPAGQRARGLIGHGGLHPCLTRAGGTIFRWQLRGLVLRRPIRGRAGRDRPIISSVS